MVSPQIAEFVRTAETNRGFWLKDVPDGTLLKVETGNDTFRILVLDAKDGKVALKATHPQLQEPMVFYHQGSTGGGSMVKMGWVGVGLHLRMNPADGGLMTTGVVKSFEVIQEEAVRSELQATAEEFEKRKSISPEEFDAAVAQLIKRDFPVQYQAEVADFVGKFCMEGKGIMLGILDQARKADKLPEALKLLEVHYREHWSYRPPPLRGSFITQQDVHYADLPYKELGLELPS